jgi:hypothetical protein
MADEINTPGKLFSISPDMWSVVENLTNDDNINLCRPFPLEEIKYAIYARM